MSKVHNVAELTERQVAPVREQLRALLSEGRAEDAIEQALAVLTTYVARATQAQLEAALRRLNKSERVDPNQLRLLLGELADAEAAQAAAPVDAEATDAVDDDVVVEDPVIEEMLREAKDERGGGTRQRGRGRLPASLPRREVTLQVPAAERVCPTCEEERHVIGHDRREVLELASVRFEVVSYVQEILGCPTCKDRIVTAPPPDEVFERSLAGPGLLAHVVVSKYADNIPAYRQSAQYARMGARISDSTLGGWIARVAAELGPLFDVMWAELCSAFVVQTDATGITVLDRDAADGKRVGAMWCYVGDGRLCAFRYAPDAQAQHGPWKYLAGRTGYIQADASNSFDRLFNGKVAHATEVGCLAHARRDFVDLLGRDERVARPLALIAQLYRVEEAATQKGLSHEERLALRRRHSRPVVEKLRKWLDRNTGRDPPQSAFAKACQYFVNHWKALTRFLEDGRLSLDNNTCEQQMRTIALGRRNSLFVGSDAGGERAAVLYSFMRTCALCGVDPQAWLADVLRKLAAGWPKARLAELLPHRWTEKRPQQLQPEPA
jgi:transposase